LLRSEALVCGRVSPGASAFGVVVRSAFLWCVRDLVYG